MNNLIDKIRKAREVNVNAAGYEFMVRRPTDEEAIKIGRGGDDMITIVKRFVIGWNLKEIDLIPGGDPQPVAFDADLFGEWVADQPLVWEPLGKAILDLYRVHAAKREEAEKN